MDTKEQDKQAQESNKETGTPADSQERIIQTLKSDGNCDNCTDGLIGDPSGKNRVCEVCNGTGKHTLMQGEYRSGTIIVLKDKGTFVVNDYGELIQQN